MPGLVPGIQLGFRETPSKANTLPIGWPDLRPPKQWRKGRPIKGFGPRRRDNPDMTNEYRNKFTRLRQP
jgi:hypothetical protein